MSSNPDKSVQSAEGSSSLVCVSCDSACSPGQKFCLQCGEALWFSCPECGDDTPVNSGFCGSCGHDLRGIFREGEQLFEQAVKEARAKAADLDLTAAIRALLSASESPKIHRRALKKELLEMIADYRRQLSEFKADAAERLKKAQFLFGKANLEQAYQTLADIPEALRTAEAEELYQNVRHQIAESKRLAAELEGLLAKKDLLNALPIVKSLLDYRPNDETLTKLAADIVKRIVNTVEKKKQEGKFREAFALIKRVGEMGKSAKTTSLKEEIEEIVWLTNYVKKVQVVDGGLLQALKKLATAVPTEENKKFLAEAEKRNRAAQAGKPTSWSPIPKELSLGIPVSVAGHWNLIDGMDAIQVDGNRHQSFHVAAGMALQGLGKAAINTDLSVKKTGFLGFALKKTGKSAWGIDFGHSSLKAVKLSLDAGETVKLEQVDLFRYSHKDARPSANDLRLSMLEALLRFKTKYDVKKDEIIVINIGYSQSLARYLSLPETDAKSRKSALEFEVKLQIPFPLADVIWDSHFFSNPGREKQQAIVVAARKNDVALITDMFTANGLKVAAIQMEPIALHNFHQLAADRSGSAARNAFLDFGFDSSTMVFSSNAGIWFRSFGVGTDLFIKSLCRNLKINTTQAEDILQDFGKAGDNIGKALMALNDPYRDLVAEVKRSLQAYEAHGDELPEQIYLLGGGATMHGMTTYLRHDIKALSVE